MALLKLIVDFQATEKTTFFRTIELILRCSLNALLPAFFK